MPESGRGETALVEFAQRRTARHPVRIVHLGLGAFHRAHQAWYTQLANDLGESWGIAAFTGRSAAAAEVLSAQDDLYTLIERGAFDDKARIIESISSAADGADAERWRATFETPDVAIVTLTITEVGYRLTTDGELDVEDPEVLADVTRLRAGQPAITAPGRLVDGLRSRMLADAGPLAIVSCDNLAANGRATRAAVRGMVRLALGESPGLLAWIDANVSFVSSMVDRITPATTDDDRAVALRLTGLKDATPVVTEPFSEWVLSGEFPAGRPGWDLAGARFVDDVTPFEQRKLWLLNAAHSLLAYRGLLVGHASVAEAMLDRDCSDAVERLWAEARVVLRFDDAEIDAALDALRKRFANPRIRHALGQIATDGSRKLAQRIADPIRLRRAAGLAAGAAQAGVLAAWALHLVSSDRRDPLADELAAAIAGLDAKGQATAVVEFLAPDLAGDTQLGDSQLISEVAAQIVTLSRRSPSANRPSANRPSRGAH